FNNVKMAVIKNIFINEHFNMVVILKISIFLLLSWIFTFFNDTCYISINMKCARKSDGMYGIWMNRLLSKSELDVGLEPNNIKEGISQNYECNELENEYEDTSIYRSLKRNNSNHMYSYRKNFKNTYAKKKGLKKLDYYCERKIFNNIDKIYKLAENGNYDKKKLKNILYKKFGYKIIFFALLSLPGSIVHILSWAKVDFKLGNNLCVLKSLIPGLSDAFFGIYCSIFLLTIIYIFIKIVKYEKLKAGKGQMNRKEYICFCKKVFNIN
ncbi:variable surface protein Vir10, truncated, putative, partial [Plasmodium vivax]